MTDYLAAIAQRAVAPAAEVQPTPASLLVGMGLPRQARKAADWETSAALPARDHFDADGVFESGAASHANPSPSPTNEPRFARKADFVLRSSPSSVFAERPGEPTPSSPLLGELSPYADEAIKRRNEQVRKQESAGDDATTGNSRSVSADLPITVRADDRAGFEQTVQTQGNENGLQPPPTAAESTVTIIRETERVKSIEITAEADRDEFGEVRSHPSLEPRAHEITPLSVLTPPVSKPAPVQGLETPPAPPETIVHVTIGRVEIRANVPAKPVLSDERRQTLEQIRSQVKSRWRVYDHWGLADTMNRGLGITSLFAGESGTGKTMAAEVIANDLDLDLFRVDLSMVVNKYIGETEKHLRRLFDAVESCGAILCFDECDALFGKRSEVKDSHDRYANIEISYLLQRLESYRGLCILTTNNRGALDSSFLRRFRFIVTFPMPTVAERKQIWQRQLGADGADSQRGRIPTSSLDYERLAQLPFSGGNIHSVIVNAAFRAAAREEAAHVTMRDILAAARDELVKLERPIDEAEFILAELAAPEAAA